mgnify:FL=1
MKKNKIDFNFVSPKLDRRDINFLLDNILKQEIPNEGKYTREFEKKIAKILKIKYVVATTSGTIAIYLALKSLNIKNGDEIIVPNITFAATVNAVSLAGAKPILVDINKNDLLIDTEKLKRKINKKTKAIITVHVSGRGSNILDLKRVAKKYKIKLIEDAAEAFISKKQNKYLGTIGDLGCFSFSPPKIITTGQGGVVVTNNLSLYKKLLQLKNQGRVGSSNGGQDRYESIGYNFKYTNLQSALGVSQLKSIQYRKKKLTDNYLFYKKNLIQNKKIKLFEFDTKNGEVPLWTDLYCSKRDELHKYLLKNGVETRLFWHPINYCKPYKQSFDNLEVSKMFNEKLLWLPSTLDLNKNDLKKICLLVNNFTKKYLQ